LQSCHQWQSMSLYPSTLSCHKYTLIRHTVCKFNAKMFPFLGNVLPENNPALEFYNYLVHRQMLRGVVQFRVSLIQGVEDGPYFL